MTRQTLVILAVAHAIGICCAARIVTAAEGKPAWPARPNIVFILADDMGYGDPGCYNPNSKCSTPNIDHLAAEGIRFTDAHTPGSVCTPTRYGLLTGRFPFRGNLDDRKLACIPVGRMTLASLLKRNGYRTAMVGKWQKLTYRRRLPRRRLEKDRPGLPFPAATCIKPVLATVARTLAGQAGNTTEP